MRRPVTLWALLTLLMALPGGAKAQASYDPVAGGKIGIALSRSFTAFLAGHGVKIKTTGGASYGGGEIVMSAAGGEFEPRLGLGTVEGRGTVVFAAGKRKVVLRDISFRTKRSPLYAKVGGGQLKLASGARITSRRIGFGSGFRATGLRLTAKTASRLKKKLRLGSDVKPGMLIGSVTASVTPATVHLEPGSRLSLALDPAFAAKLNSLFVSVNPIAPAELAAGPVLTFPVGLESTLAPDAGSGTVKFNGSVELLQLGSAQIFWHELWLEPSASTLLAETDVEPSPPHPGKQAQAPLFSIGDDGTVGADDAARTIQFAGRSVTLSPGTAEALNDAFTPGSSAFAAGETIGSISLTAAAE